MDGNGNGDLRYRADWSTSVKSICLEPWPGVGNLNGCFTVRKYLTL
jgi:hypothetical protein